MSLIRSDGVGLGLGPHWSEESHDILHEEQIVYHSFLATNCGLILTKRGILVIRGLSDASMCI